MTSANEVLFWLALALLGAILAQFAMVTRE
jgi:hypothetical protein